MSLITGNTSFPPKVVLREREEKDEKRRKGVERKLKKIIKK